MNMELYGRIGLGPFLVKLSISISFFSSALVSNSTLFTAEWPKGNRHQNCSFQLVENVNRDE